MIINLLIARFFKRDLASQTEPLDQDIEHDEQAEAQQKSKLLTILATHLHLTTMLPLAIITILADINLGLAAVICVAEIIFFMIIGYLLYRKRYIKVRTRNSKRTCFVRCVCRQPQVCCEPTQGHLCSTHAGWHPV